MNALLGTVFVASLLGSLHCIGMCGPFALLAGSSASDRQSAMVPALAYNFGRLVMYAFVGALFGMLGLALNAGTSFTTWQQSATFVAGLAMVVIGAIALLRCFGFRLPLPTFFQPLQRQLQNGLSWARTLPQLPRALLVGMLTSLMPCGWLYTFAITAAGTGSPVYGAILMTVFWAGTVPVMACLMLGFGRIHSSIQQHIPATMAALVLAVGVFTMTFRAPVTIEPGDFQVQTNQSELVHQVEQIDQHELPCCQGGSHE